MQNIVVLIDGVPHKLVPVDGSPQSWTSIENTGLCTRVKNALREGNVFYLEQLLGMTERDILRFPNIGRMGLNEIHEELARRGMHVGQLPPL